MIGEYIHPVFGAGPFEDFPVSPRILSMGGASTVLSDDASSVYTNPSGMVQCQKIEINSSYADLYGADGLYFGSLSIVLPLSGVAWGFSWQRMELPLVYNENVFTFSFAKQLSDYISAGISVNNLRSSILGLEVPVKQNTTSIAALNAGVMWQFNDEWMGGVLFERINEPSLSSYLGGGSQKLNSYQRAGIKYQPFDSGIVALEYIFGLNEISAGFEVIVGNILPLRIGVNHGRLTFGAGVEIQRWGGVDFALLTDANLGNLYYGGFRFKL